MPRQTPSLRSEVQAFRRERILAAACDLFSERGYAAATTEALAERLSISKAMIYSHFSGKQELLAAVCHHGVTRSVELARKAYELQGTARERLAYLIRGFVQINIENRDFTAVTTREMHILPEADRRAIAGLQGNFDRLLHGLIEEGIEAGEFETRDPGLAVLLIGGMIIWQHTWFRDNGRLSPQQIADETCVACMKMLAPARAS